MFGNQFKAAAMAVAMVGAIGGSAHAQVSIESSESEASVIVTKSLEDYGIGQQDAHEIALLATKGVVLAQEPTVCLVYMVTVHWCEVANGSTVPKRMRFRMDASCISASSNGIMECLNVPCPPGCKPMLVLPTGPGACAPMPTQSCVLIEITGPVESTCDTNFDCSCLPLPAGQSCTNFVKCVDIEYIPGGGGCVPLACPSCN